MLIRITIKNTAIEFLKERFKNGKSFGFKNPKTKTLGRKTCNTKCERLMNFKAQTRQKFPFATISGDGAFAVVRKDRPRWVVFLYTTRQRAENALARRRADFIVELDPPYIPTNSPIAPSSGIDWGRD